MKLVRLETKTINDWKSFHLQFANLMGFPAFYGQNMNAWIDCMSSLANVNSGMSKIHLEPKDALVVEISDSDSFAKRLPEIQQALIECTAFVNQRYAAEKEHARIALAFI